MSSGLSVGDLLLLGVAAASLMWLLWGTSDGPEAQPRDLPVPYGPVGFRGWLLLLAVGQMIAPFVLLQAAFAAFSVRSYAADGQSDHTLFVTLSLAYVVLALIAAYAAWKMLNRSRQFPRLFVMEWLVMLCFVLAVPMLVAVTRGVAVGSAYGDSDFVLGALKFLVSGLWVWYVLQSVRVRNTFVE